MAGTAGMAAYLRIASDLRRRIHTGELRGGEPIPSTRRIARDWKVAMATATKALLVLSQEGLVQAIPRVGTVVRIQDDAQAIAAAARPRDKDLSRARIVEAAVAIADAEGIEALSIRGVAARLYAPAMSLYRHVSSKEDLIDAMIDATLGEESLPRVPPAGWRTRLELGARVEWKLYRRHPWLARVMTITRPRPLPNAIRYAEWILSALDGLGLDPTTMLQIHITMHSYVQGMAVNLEVEAEAQSHSGMDDQAWMKTQEAAFASLVASGAYPVFSRTLSALKDDFDLDLDAAFIFGLRPLLDGFASQIERAQKRHRRR